MFAVHAFCIHKEHSANRTSKYFRICDFYGSGSYIFEYKFPYILFFAFPMKAPETQHLVMK